MRLSPSNLEVLPGDDQPRTEVKSGLEAPDRLEQFERADRRDRPADELSTVTSNVRDATNR